jgi:uncharacterized protein
MKINYKNELIRYANDILTSKNMQITKNHIQHGETSVFEHSVAVAVKCLSIADRFDIDVDRQSLIRGALLHDYFLYDWHTSPKEHRPHGFTHARTALKNARRDFSVNMLEAEMIYCHMFPMNILRLPMHRESMILCIADKIVSTKETLEGGKRLIQRTGGVLIGAVH